MASSKHNVQEWDQEKKHEKTTTESGLASERRCFLSN